MRYTNDDPLTAREEVLLRGLIDWVAFERVHQHIAWENVGQPLAIIQNKTLDLVRSLVSDGLFEVGELSDASRFIAWNVSLDEALQRIRDAYITNFDDEPLWWFCCWLDLTEHGQQVAEDIEASMGANDR